MWDTLKIGQEGTSGTKPLRLLSRVSRVHWGHFRQNVRNVPRVTATIGEPKADGSDTLVRGPVRTTLLSSHALAAVILLMLYHVAASANAVIVARYFYADLRHCHMGQHMGDSGRKTFEGGGHGAGSHHPCDGLGR